MSSIPALQAQMLYPAAQLKKEKKSRRKTLGSIQEQKLLFAQKNEIHGSNMLIKNIKKKEYLI